MRQYGITDCPDWCEQPADEPEHQQHTSQLDELRTDDGDVIQVRARLGWDDGGDDRVQIVFTTADGSNEIWLDPDDKSQLDDMLDAADDLITSGYTPKEAYPGAWDEEEDDGEDD